MFDSQNTLGTVGLDAVSPLALGFAVPTHGYDVGAGLGNQVAGLSSSSADGLAGGVRSRLSVGQVLASSPGGASGVFTVGAAGQVGLDFLFDGGGYEGELAIVSLAGMETEMVGSLEFFREAARRALSDSPLGHVVIADATEGARFSALSEWEGDFNAGVYAGVKQFAMTPGDRFMVMLVPQGTVRDVWAAPGVGDAQQPLFSLMDANPDGTRHVAQIADVNGRGTTFALEDLRTDLGSDRDYNDVIFQVRGAVGTAVSLNAVVAPELDWRGTTMGRDLLRYSLPNSAQPMIGVIDTGLAVNNPDIDPYRVHLGRDYVAGDGNPLLSPGEGNQHGTHIAGILAATANNGFGIDGLTTAETPLYVARAIGSGNWAQALRDFVDYSKEMGQRHAIANLSLDLTQLNPNGTVTTRYEFTPQERSAIEYARQNNVLIVAAAGNTGGIMSVLGQASQEFDNIITVGAAAGGQRASYSGYGYGLDLLAEGGSVENPVLSTVADGVGTMAGSSVAAARVAAVAAQLWAANPGLDDRQVIDILKTTATDLNAPGWDLQSGFGIVNPVRALEKARQTVPDFGGAPAAFSTPTTWSGAGQVLPLERPVADAFAGSYWEWRSYTIRPGDTLSGIALSTMGNSSPDYYNFIARRNGISDPNLIYAGNTIQVPYQVPAPSSSSNSGGGNSSNNGGTSGSSGSGGISITSIPRVTINTGSSSSNFNPNSGSNLTNVQPTVSAYGVTGAFAAVYPQYRGFLGSPTSNVLSYGNATYQYFQNGSIVSSPFGTYALYGGVRQTYLATGGLEGWMGMPTGPAQDQGNGVLRQAFENGYVIWNGYKATAYQVGNGQLPGFSPTPQPINLSNVTGWVMPEVPSGKTIGNIEYELPRKIAPLDKRGAYPGWNEDYYQNKLKGHGKPLFLEYLKYQLMESMDPFILEVMKIFIVQGWSNAKLFLQHWLDNSGDRLTLNVNQLENESSIVKNTLSRVKEDVTNWVRIKMKEGFTDGTLEIGAQGIDLLERFPIAKNDWSAALGKFDHSHQASFSQLSDGRIEITLTSTLTDVYDFDPFGPGSLIPNPLEKYHYLGTAQNFISQGSKTDTYYI